LSQRVSRVRGDVGSAPLAPGDPGTCPGDPPRGYARDAPDDARALAARAVVLRGALTPPQRSICARAAQTRRDHVGRSLAG